MGEQGYGARRDLHADGSVEAGGHQDRDRLGRRNGQGRRKASMSDLVVFT